MPDLRDSITQEFRETKQRIDQLKAEARSRAKITFEAGTEKLFEAHPVIQNFGWNQYTPYFNDGEPCEFGVGEVSINLITEDNDAPPENVQIAQHLEDVPSTWFEEYEHPFFYGYGDANKTNKEIGWGADKRLNPNYDPVYAEAQEAVLAFRNIFDEDDLEDLFGDHCVVFVTRNGVQTDDHDHD